MGWCMLCLSLSNCSLNHSAMGFRSMARSNLVPSVRAFSTCPHLFGLEFPLVFLRIEFPCVFQRFSLDERCCLPIAEPDKAAEFFDTEYFTKIGNFIIYIPYFYNLFLIHICTTYIQYSQNLATSTSSYREFDQRARKFTSAWGRSLIFLFGSGCSQHGFRIHWY